VSVGQRESLLRIVESKDRLGGRFTNIQRIDPTGGGGNFSLVFSAKDEVSAREVALKFYDPLKRSDRYRFAAFEREAAVLGELSGQPDVLQILAPLDTFIQPFTAGGISIGLEFSYFAIELANSNALEAIAFDIWTAEEALVAFRAMCRAVQRLHSLQYAHRDIKPSNFLVTRNGSVCLSDFGTARSVSASSAALLQAYGFWPGDYGYAAPEVLAGLHDEHPAIAQAADLYALGCVLYELFAGVRLSSQLLDADLTRELVVLMGQVPSGDRRRIFLEVVPALADAHPIPSVRVSGGRTPPSIRARVDGMVSLLSSLDYRRRPRSFEAIFRSIDICLLVLRNEAKYSSWRRERRMRRKRKMEAGVD
jgi:serine/threonine protein kinase